jgi:transposase
MTYMEHGMWEILDVLRRLRRGESLSKIQAATRRSRTTIRRWRKTALNLGWVPGGNEPDELLATRILERHQPGPCKARPGEVERRLLPHLEQIKSWLAPPSGGERGLQLTKVHTLLTRKGINVPYGSLHRFAQKYCQFRRKRLTVRMAEPSPGEVAEVDFGRMGLVLDPVVDRRRVLHALIVTLCYSRHQYVHFTHSQKLSDLIDGLEAAWEFFGGTPIRVVIDNLRDAVNKADRYDPIFQRTFAEYADHRGFIIDPAPVRAPRGKPRVERNVSYVRENFFRGEQWRDRDHVEREGIRWCLQVAGTRVHGTTLKRPLAVFEDVEKAVLKPLTGERFDTPQWAECTVHPDHHVQFRKATYSVPSRYCRKKVTVRGDRGLVRIYYRGTLIKTHPTQPPGGRSTDYADYPQELTNYTLRDPKRLIRQAREQGAYIGRFAQALLAGNFPWAKLRQAQKLLRLSNKYGTGRVDLACRRAMAFDLINVRRLERIINQGLEGDALPNKPGEQIILLSPKFLRPEGSFTHPRHEKEEPDHGG